MSPVNILVWFLCLEWHIKLHGLSSAKAILVEEELQNYLNHSWQEDKRVHTFPKDISQKVNATSRQEIERAFYNVAQDFRLLRERERERD